MSAVSSAEMLANFQALSTYFGQMESYCAGTSLTLPYFPDIVASLVSDQTYAEVFATGSRDYSYSTGLKIQTVDMISSIQREAAFRAKSKLGYYLDAANTANADSQFLLTQGYKEVGAT